MLDILGYFHFFANVDEFEVYSFIFIFSSVLLVFPGIEILG